jgi:alginate O-acetyltransferase complex protein AlgJ
VTTVNRGYRRTESQVLVRKVTRATRANLDYAAYHANFMNADPEPENPARGSGKPIEAAHPFAGALEKDSLTGDFAALPLTADERAHPLALAPLVELLASKHVAGADALEDVTSKVRAESWGQPGGPQFVRQTAELGYLHRLPAAPGWELWVKVEFAPWFHDMGALPDADHDGFGEVYGRVPAAALGADLGALVKFVADEYAGRVLSAAEVKGWAHQLASYWYPSYNTDLVGSAGRPGSAPASWPDSETEPAVVHELGGQVFDAPTVVMRGKPEGKPVYNVFLVEGVAGGGGKDGGAGHPGDAAPAAVTPAATPRLPHTAASPEPAPVVTAIEHELAAHGGSWNRWGSEVAPLRELMERKLGAIPHEAKATAGGDGFLFFGQSLAYAVGGDLEKQKRPKNPVPAIVQFRKLLAEHGVDLLFVPVPTKEEIFPDKLGITPEERALGARFVGQVVNPFERKFLVELGDKGVEVVDLLPGFLAARTAEVAAAARAPAPAPVSPAPGLFQAQDTHWTNRGLELAAHTVAERVRRYPWFAALAAHRHTYSTRPAPFSRHGDLHSRLPEADKARYAPEALVGDQVFTDAGVPYEDDPDSPIVVLGDSFTGVFELMDCEHAGVSAHLARELGYPVDLVMSYGGGPNVRQKLLRRGVEALAAKKLVIWMMTARDLHDFWEGWQMVTSR